MKVILTEEVSNLGSIGQIVQVKNGYARNYLLPRSLAVVANESNKKELEHRQRTLAIKRAKVLEAFEKTARMIAKVKVSIEKQVGEDDKIFGTVTTAEIAQILKDNQLDISKKDIVLTEEIKTVGKYTAEVHLHPEVTAKVNLKVVAKP